MTISKRLAARICVIAASGLVILAVGQARTTHRLMERGLERRAAAIADTIKELTADDVRSRTPLDSKLLEHFVTLQGVRFIGLYLPDGAPLIELVSPMTAREEEDQSSYSFDLSDDAPLGTLRIRMSRRNLDAVAAAIGRNGFIIGGMVVLALALGTNLMTRRLGDYLERFADAVKSVSGTDLPPIPAGFQGSELATIENSFRDLVSRLEVERALREDVARQKDEMAAMLVHDLKHPLTVLGTLLVIQRDPELKAVTQEERDKHLQMATRALRRLNSMIEDILHIARLNDSQVEIPKELLRWESLVGEFEDENRLIAEGAGRRFSVHCEPEALGLRTFANARLIKRLIGNLVLNAIENSPKDAMISIGLERSKEQLGRVRLSVMNSGSRIPASELDSVFKRYFTSGRSSRNVGLGLSFCRLAADAHGAFISVDSDDDGTRFSVLISYVDAQSPHGASVKPTLRAVSVVGSEVAERESSREDA